MKIFVTGTRGVPDIPGGVEKHCQGLYPLIAARGHDVVIATRKPYLDEVREEWHGIRLTHLYTPRVKSFEAIIHTFLAVLKARMWQPDILHIHGIGPGLMVPLARILGMKVVVTNHGPDYDRQKWGKTARAMLRLGEWTGGKFANRVIVISSIIRETLHKRCGRECPLICNGVALPEISQSRDFLDDLKLAPGRYILAVSRLVPEKGLHLLIEAFKGIEAEGYKLVIAGDADHETDYSRRLKKAMADDERVVGTGYVTGEKLCQVFSHAALFVLPSYHEGHPIVLLEAMSYGLPVLVSDIPANRQVDLPEERFFKCGDLQDLKKKLHGLLSKITSEDEKDDFRCQIEEKYNWSKIADKTLAVYETVFRQGC
jgi:glycosyltransferase involved in cell wall biosynthesis